MDETTTLLKDLTEAHGVPGYETEVRALVKQRLEGLGDLTRDNLGSVICTKKGGSGTRVMLAGHMDEVGFMVKHITDDGFVKFLPLGGWWDQVLLGQRVTIKTRKGDLTGVIGAKPPHLLDSDERNKLVKKTDMYIDIGAGSKDQVVEAGVRAGDPIIPQAAFEELAIEGRYLSKAFDDRVGVALIVSALQRLQETEHPNTVYGAVTTQEEVGLRGARTTAEVIEPHVAIILESDIAGDVPGIKPEVSNVKLGSGPSMLLYDRSMIPNLALRDLVMDTAEEHDIPLQTNAMTAGGTDGGVIHTSEEGVPTVVLGVPARHIHSHGAIIDRGDYDHAVDLLVALITKLDEPTVRGLIPE